MRAAARVWASHWRSGRSSASTAAATAEFTSPNIPVTCGERVQSACAAAGSSQPAPPVKPALASSVARSESSCGLTESALHTRVHASGESRGAAGSRKSATVNWASAGCALGAPGERRAATAAGDARAPAGSWVRRAETACDAACDACETAEREWAVALLVAEESEETPSLVLLPSACSPFFHRAVSVPDAASVPSLPISPPRGSPPRPATPASA